MQQLSIMLNVQLWSAHMLLSHSAHGERITCTSLKLPATTTTFDEWCEMRLGLTQITKDVFVEELVE